MASAKTYGNLIGGKYVPAKSGKTFENLSPADTSDVVGVFASSEAADVDAAVQAAAKAYETWCLTPAPKRAEILYRCGELLLKRKDRNDERNLKLTSPAIRSNTVHPSAQ